MINFVKANAIFKDRQAVILMTVGAGLALLSVLVALLFVESKTFKVDVRYSGYDRTLSDKGDWYTLYVFPLFAVLSHIINSYLALKAHSIQRMLSLTILSFNIIVLLFALRVSWALFDLL